MMSIDLRSDTVTRPSVGMREAMAAAPVGDDVFGDDPTVIRLQEMTAQMLGKEAGLYVPSGETIFNTIKKLPPLILSLSHSVSGLNVIVPF